MVLGTQIIFRKAKDKIVLEMKHMIKVLHS